MNDTDPVNVNILQSIDAYPFLLVGNCYTIPRKYAEKLIEGNCAEMSVDILDQPIRVFGIKTFETVTIALPQQEMDYSFVKRLSENLNDKEVNIFFEPSSCRVCELIEWKDEHKDHYIFGKKDVDALRLKAILEELFVFFTILKREDGSTKLIYKSPSKGLLDYSMSSDSFRNSIRKISGVFESPFLYVIGNDLKVTKNGYNADCCVYVRQNAPEVKLLDIEQAKQLLKDCLLDFPFESEQDKVFAIASIITPMLRGLYQEYGVRTPLFCYLGNQQGCGKDYCAGIRQLIYTGKFNEDAPLSNEKGSNSEETDKVFITAAITGQQFMHFSNCRGFLANASLEKHQTAASIRGRVLGSNTQIDVENILETSISGNYGLSFNRDFARRSIFINLFTEVEDTTKRKFTKNLHQWIKDNRGAILSAIYTLIYTWWYNGNHKPGQGINASYSTWARFCSGVMEYHNLGDPCAPNSQVINDVGGDTETKDISRFNKEIGDWLNNPENSITGFVTEHDKQGITKKEIFALFVKVFEGSDDRPFSRFDMDTPKDRRELGRIINRYLGTYRGGYKMIVSKNNDKLDRVCYKFVPTVPTVLTLLSPHTGGGEALNRGINLTQLGQLTHISDGTLPENSETLTSFNQVVINPTQLQKDNGEVFESKPGVWRKVH